MPILKLSQRYQDPKIASTGNSFGGTLTGVANLAAIFLGNTTNTNQTGTTTDNRSAVTTNSGGTTVTTSEQSVAPGAVDALIKSILEGTNGLAAVATGQKQAGLYNSTTNRLLVNDLAARAAAEGAKLNQKTTQTTVTPQTTQTVNNSGGTTTSQNQTAVKQAPVSAGIGIGALTALQLIPKDTKDSFFKSLTGAAGAAKAAQADTDLSSVIAGPSGNGDFGYDSVTGAPIGNDGLAQITAGVGADVANIADTDAQAVSGFTDFSSTMSDVIDPIDSTGAIADGISSATDFVSGLSDLDFSDSFDSVLSTAADAGVDAFDFLGFADGGMVDIKNLPQTQSEYDARNGERLAALMSAKPAFGPKGYADGGAVKSGATPKSYLPNTGLRSKIPALLQADSPDNNIQELSSIISRASANSGISVAATPVRSANNSARVSGRNTSSGEAPATESSSAEAVEGTNIGEVSGIANALGISPGQAKAGITGLSQLSGIGLSPLSGLGTARNNQEAVASIGLTGLSMLNPALAMGVAVAKALGAFGQSSGAGPGNTDPFGGISVAGAYGPQSSTPDLQALGTDPLAGTSPDFSGSAAGTDSGGFDGSGDAGGSTGSTGAGSSEGSSVGGNFKSGGEINGPGTGTSDSIPAKLSDGEYVIPADVVEALGVGFFDNLRAKFHTPVAMQQNRRA